ncbi:hypothetical protein LAZ67_18002356 [Cordylochernes scorpioides]|uniref:Tetraspanin n=1 Tax=Cordylochernes scorpioides TaxID=51811 RepID=A0ABY6LKR6_9ARAC|nr:hypothetical protein LAZ67_18002356 [Cordylochernes scorpioides]
MMCLGFALLGIGVWIRSDTDFWEYHNTLPIPQYYVATYVAMVIGVVLLITGFLGCFGAAVDSPCLLLSAIVFMAMMVLCQIVASCFVWKMADGDKVIQGNLPRPLTKVSEVPALRQMDSARIPPLFVALTDVPVCPQLQQFLIEEIRQQIELSKGGNEQAKRFLNLLQLHLECCGGYDMQDYHGTTIPQSCNSDRTNNIYIHGCGENLRRYLEIKAGTLGGICLGLGMLEDSSFIYPKNNAIAVIEMYGDLRLFTGQQLLYS